MRIALGYVAVAFTLFWVVKDPTGAANTVAHVASQVGVWASTLAQHLSTSKPALAGDSARVDLRQGQP